MRALALIAALAAASQAPIPPSPVRHLTDTVGFLSPATAGRVDAKLDGYERATGHQILVWIGDSIGGYPLDDWAVKTFAAWKVGRKGVDDGLVLFVLAKDRKMDIEVGYGLEDRVPDARAKQIIEDTIAPLLRAGKNDDAIAAGADAILTAIEGHPVGDSQAPPPRAAPKRHPLSTGQLILYGILAVILLVFIVTHPQMALFFLMNIMSGGRFGGGGGWGDGDGGGGGGWSGGGGRSGGGGARGSW